MLSLKHRIETSSLPKVCMKMPLKRYGLEGKSYRQSKRLRSLSPSFQNIPLPVSTKAMTDFHQSSSPITLMQQPVPVSFTVLLHTVWTTTSPLQERRINQRRDPQSRSGRRRLCLLAADVCRLKCLESSAQDFGCIDRCRQPP